MKITVIGAGSHFTVNLLRALYQSEDPESHSLRFMDTRPSALDAIDAVMRRFNAASGRSVGWTTHTDRVEAIAGADHVLAAYAVEFPSAFLRTVDVLRGSGISLVEGETATPGALLATLRTLPTLVEISAEVKAHADGAWIHIINNPMPRLVRGIIESGYERVVGHCHGTIHERDFLSTLLDVPAVNIQLDLIGVNHFHLVQGARDERDGTDLLARLKTLDREHDERWRDEDFTMWKLHQELGHLIGHGVWHNYDYLPYANPRMFRYSYLNTWPDYCIALSAERKLGHREVDARFPSDEVARAYLGGHEWEQIFPVMAALSGVTPPYQFLSGNLPNRGVVPSLPADAVIEMPALVSKDTLTLTPPVAPLPAFFRSWLNQHIAVQELSVASVLHRSRQFAIEAIAADPSFRDSRDTPADLLDAMLRANAGLVPELH